MSLTPLKFICDIIQTDMGLSDGQVYTYNQKINIPTDSQLYIAVGELSSKPFGSSLTYGASGSASGYYSTESVNVMTTVSVDIMSRSTEALHRKEEVVMALNSHYSIQIQEANSFSIAKLPINLVNLGHLEGTAIPYRFNFSFNITYFKSKIQSIDYYDTFSEHTIID